jgi:hypothetical protein
MPARSVQSLIALLFLAASAQATELDRLRELDRARQETRATFDREFAELARLEPERIAAESGRVVRRGDELALALGTGGHTFLRNDASLCLEGVIPSRNDGCVAFFFIGHPQRFYLLRARYDAGSDFRLIDDRTGVPTKIPAEPHFSPDGTRLVTVSAANAYDPVGVEVWSLAAEAPSLEWKHDPDQYAIYSFLRWDSDADVALEVETYVAHELRRLPAHLIRGEGGWLLHGPAESSRY